MEHYLSSVCMVFWLSLVHPTILGMQQTLTSGLQPLVTTSSDCFKSVLADYEGIEPS